ncbi:hypothetical protein SASPL_120824 [Salvia splendens]|uniref:Reverse transcriptase Ty1/copia-type domain-containing protein n=1 Tax=Salvia splendens TaxID=180675 RepID=A0A8X8XQC8_SALSN|nr:hypothetical protein SASPL_120824 [Salvia splendens]
MTSLLNPHLKLLHPVTSQLKLHHPATLLSASYHSLFYKYSPSGSYFGVVIYVDDILVASSDDNMISEFKIFLADHFKFKDLGYPKYFLGIEIARNKSGIFIFQHNYALDLVSDAGLLSCKPASTPMDSIKQLQVDAGPPLEDPTVYRRLVGRLVYLCITRLDITFAVNKLSQFLSKPCSDHLVAAERVLKYLKGTVGHGLFYSAQTDLSLSIFSDADWAGCPDTRRSISGNGWLILKVAATNTLAKSVTGGDSIIVQLADSPKRRYHFFIYGKEMQKSPPYILFAANSAFAGLPFEKPCSLMNGSPEAKREEFFSLPNTPHFPPDT